MTDEELKAIRWRLEHGMQNCAAADIEVLLDEVERLRQRYRETLRRVERLNEQLKEPLDSYRTLFDLTREIEHLYGWMQ